jgi:hypothetical protein
MSKDRSLVRASDMGAWAYCRRAWWLAKVKGARHEQPARLVAGTQTHRRHGQTVARAGRYGKLGWALVAIGLLGAIAGVILAYATGLMG